MTIKFFGLKIKVTYLFAAIICLMLFIDRTGLALPVLFAVAAHEAAHLIAMKRLGCAPSEIELIPGSVRIINPQSYNRKNENIILLCGPICNIILFGALYGIFLMCGSLPLGRAAAVQLVIAVFNLLPARGLDGGALLYNFLLSLMSVTRATLIYICVSIFTGTFFISFGILSAVTGTVNPSALVLGLYIIILSFSK